MIIVILSSALDNIIVHALAVICCVCLNFRAAFPQQSFGSCNCNWLYFTITSVYLNFVRWGRIETRTISYNLQLLANWPNRLIDWLTELIDWYCYLGWNFDTLILTKKLYLFIADGHLQINFYLTSLVDCRLIVDWLLIDYSPSRRNLFLFSWTLLECHDLDLDLKTLTWRLWYRYIFFFADGHLQKLLLTACRDVAVVVVVVVEVVEVVAEVVADGDLQVFKFFKFCQVG